MSKKAKIIIIVVVAIIILTIAGILIYKNYFSKKAKAQKESDKLQEQLNNPLLTSEQRKSVLQQLDLLAGVINEGDSANSNTQLNTPHPPQIQTYLAPPSSSGSGCKPVNFPVKKGMCGAEVKKIQTYLNKYSPSACKDKVKAYLPLVVDGNFGAKTEAVYKACYTDLAVEKSVYNSMASVV